MKRKVIYHNAGNAGREFSRLSIHSRLRLGPNEACHLQFYSAEAGRINGNVVLSRAQAAHLRDWLTELLGAEPTPPPPMIEESDD